MPIDVVMPQMGESIAEGTVIRWMKKLGEKVERDEPIFEISTDKVDAEIPAPASGVLAEILVPEGKTVAVNTVVARLSGEGEATSSGTEAKATAAPPSEPSTAVEEPPATAAPTAAPTATPSAPSAPKASPQPQAEMENDENAAEPTTPPATASGEASEPISLEDRRRTRSSPLVRKIARENDVDISRIEGTGVSGRVTKKDILQFIESPPPKPAAAAAAVASQRAPARVPAAGGAQSSGEVRIEPMSMMRKKIADHMVLSKRTSAHVTTVFEVDFTEIDKLRRRNKDSYRERGANLTYLPFIVQSVITAIREFPILNASIDGDNVVYKNEINIGIAVALDWGLIVPVLKRADEKNIFGLARTINDLGERAKTKKLNPDEVQGGTFTITNPGVFGGLFGTPIINQPQVAILGVGGVKKRPVVIETDEGDAIVIRSMCYLALSFDHRLIDGAVADQFMARVRSIIEMGEFML